MKKSLLRVSWSIGIIFILVLAGYSIWKWNWESQLHSSPEPGSLSSHDPTEQGPDEAGSKWIRLSASKREAANIRTASLERRPWNASSTIPAKLELDPDRHFAITAPVDVVVEDMLVPLGSLVEAGSPLLILSAPEVTRLRGEIEAGRSKWKLAEESLSWYLTAQKNIGELRSVLQDSQWATGEWNSESKIMGKHGGAVLEAYARFHAARTLVRGISNEQSSGALPEKIVAERQGEFAARKANLASAIEQATFDLAQEVQKARIEVEVARSALSVTEAEMLHLQGARGNESTNDLSHQPSISGSPNAVTPDTYVFHSPRTGTLVERFYARGERATTGESLVLIADLSQLWVVGELRAHHWQWLPKLKEMPLQLEVLGLESMGLVDVQLVFIGGNVDAQSGSIRIAASVKNDQGWLRPGMFAKLVINEWDSSPTTIVPSQAIFTQDNQAYLLIEHESNQFELLPVEIGRRTDRESEVLTMVNEGAKIVVQGVFTVASEGLLESEEE